MGKQGAEVQHEEAAAWVQKSIRTPAAAPTFYEMAGSAWLKISLISDNVCQTTPQTGRAAQPCPVRSNRPRAGRCRHSCLCRHACPQTATPLHSNALVFQGGLEAAVHGALGLRHSHHLGALPTAAVCHILAERRKCCRRNARYPERGAHGGSRRSSGKSCGAGCHSGREALRAVPQRLQTVLHCRETQNCAFWRPVSTALRALPACSSILSAGCPAGAASVTCRPAKIGACC